MAFCTRALTLAFVLAYHLSPQAHTVREVELECPLDGEKFRQVLAASGTQFGAMLDLKPIGRIAAPWPLPVCPKSGFVMYRSFTPDEIARLKPFVATTEYAEMLSDAPYFRAARIGAFLGDKREAIADVLLQATWEAQSPRQYARYAREAHVAFRELLEMTAREDASWPKLQVVTGELERRLGRFDEARARFSQLKELERFRTGSVALIIDLQLRLIEQGNTRAHRMPTGGGR